MKTISIDGGKRSNKTLRKQLRKGFRELIVRIHIENKRDIILYYQIRNDIDFSRFHHIPYYEAKCTKSNIWMFLPEKYQIESEDKNLIALQDFLETLVEDLEYFAYEVHH